MSTITGIKTPVVVPEAPKQDQINPVKEISKDEVANKMSTEEYVRQYFSDEPVMIAIAKCESHFRQLDADGDIHRGVVNHSDVGVMQINEFYHLDEALKANYDIYSLEGNVAFAQQLYEKEGTAPWSSSRACWGKYENTTLAINVK